MAETYSTEIYRQEGAEFRSLSLSINPDGSLHLHALDDGKVAETIWGHDYEFWIDVPATAFPKLVFALLREKYLGQSEPVADLRAFCEKEGISHKWDCR